MPVVNLRPITPGQRFTVRVVHRDIHKGRPERSLTQMKTRTSGRNSAGRITVRHRGGGHKRLYRIIDFKRDKQGIPARLERIEYDPNRSALIGLFVYMDGERRYSLLPEGMSVGDSIVSGPDAPIATGNCLPLENIPVGTVVHCVEVKPGQGATMVRTAGASAQILAREGDYATLRLRSGEMRRVRSECVATLGVVSNSEHGRRKLGKAGASRWRGIRPTVRGVAMNPVDHPHGGGEGKTSGGRHPVSPTGVPAKGYRTRKKSHRNDHLIVRSRHRRKR